MTTDDKVLPRSSIEEVSRQNKKSVEPSSCLIDGFRDEISRERSFELVLVLKGVVDLGPGHPTRTANGQISTSMVCGVESLRSRFEPTIEDFLDSLEGRSSILRRNGDVINFVTMNIG